MAIDLLNCIYARSKIPKGLLFYTFNGIRSRLELLIGRNKWVAYQFKRLPAMAVGGPLDAPPLWPTIVRTTQETFPVSPVSVSWNAASNQPPGEQYRSFPFRLWQSEAITTGNRLQEALDNQQQQQRALLIDAWSAAWCESTWVYECAWSLERTHPFSPAPCELQHTRPLFVFLSKELVNRTHEPKHHKSASCVLFFLKENLPSLKFRWRKTPTVERRTV